MSINMDIKTERFEDFNVHYIEKDGAYSFIHIELNEESFYNVLFDYIFSETNLIQYIKSKKNIEFSPCRENYVTLYKHLHNYIDLDKVVELTIEDNELLPIINDEYDIIDDDNKFIARCDKFGKIGEYMFSIILLNYFNFTSIIPKMYFTTDNNMSVYGIDSLFYSEAQNMIMFGESKFTKKISNGIGMIRKSLSSYEEQIEEEYRLILSGEILKNIPNIFNEKFGEARDISYTFQDFIVNANIQSIGVPVFIAHGEILDESFILKKLIKIPKQQYFGLKTLYYFISLPIKDKFEMMSIFKSKITERIEVYQND